MKYLFYWIIGIIFSYGLGNSVFLYVKHFYPDFISSEHFTFFMGVTYLFFLFWNLIFLDTYEKLKKENRKLRQQLKEVGKSVQEWKLEK